MVGVCARVDTIREQGVAAHQRRIARLTIPSAADLTVRTNRATVVKAAINPATAVGGVRQEADARSIATDLKSGALWIAGTRKYASVHRVANQGGVGATTLRVRVATWILYRATGLEPISPGADVDRTAGVSTTSLVAGA